MKYIKTRQKEWSKLSLNKRHIVNHRKRKNLIFLFIKSTIFFLISLTILLSIYILKGKTHPLYLNPLYKINTSGYTTDNAAIEDKLKKLLEHASLSVETTNIASDSAIVVKNSNGEIYTFSLTKNLAQQTASLQHIKTQLTIEGKRLKTVDFRFNNPVVTLF